MFRAWLSLLFDVFDLRDFVDQRRHLLAGQWCVLIGILHHDRAVKDFGHPPIHVDGSRLVGAVGCHGDDRVDAGFLRRPCIEQDLRYRDARSPEDDG